MNEVIENIFTRRSVRHFREKNISKEHLKIIAEAAVYAPSGMNRQTWQFTVVQNKDILKKLAAAAEKELGRENYDFYKPDTLIIASNVKESIWGVEDCACALENIFLAAHSLGIGSVWINQIREICDRESVRMLLREIGVPDGHAVYGCAALGYSDEEGHIKVEKKNNIKYVF